MEKSSKELLQLPFVRIAPFAAAGMLLAFFGGSAVCAILFACAAAFAVYSAAKRRKMWLCAAAFALGILVSGLYIKLYCEPVLEYSGKTVRGEFTVREITYSGSGYQRVTAVMSLGRKTAKVSLNSEQELDIGDRASAEIAFGEYDDEYLLYDLANGIFLSGSASDIEITSAKMTLAGSLQMLRGELITSVKQTMLGDECPLLLAMVFGEDGELTPTMREKLRISGAAHYTAVSGTHFAVFGTVLMMLIPKDRKRLKAIFPLLFAPIAVLFFGTSASVLRAAAMFFLSGLAPIFKRKAETLNTLCAAFTLIAVVSPGIVLDAGFAMSVFGVLGAGVVGPRLAERLCAIIPKKLKFLNAPVTAITVSISAVICTAPISAAVFKGVSLIGALTSILLLPLMMISTVFALLAGITLSPLLALPAVYAMRTAKLILDVFGSKSLRLLWLPLDFEGAGALAALFAAMLIIGAFASPKTLKLAAGCMAALAVFSITMSVHSVNIHHEVRFVGNSKSGAAVVLNGNSAAVVISGSGSGLTEKISRTLREGGAKNVSILMAENADFNGALAITELGELIDIDRICSTPIAAAVITDREVELISENSALNVGGVTIAAARYTETDVNADIAVYHGSFRKTSKSSAGTAVYFTNYEPFLPENGVNALRDEVVISLPIGGRLTVENG